MATTKPIIGGGVKKVLYTLNTVKRIGLLDSAKALNSKNTCKACGLGMGGQLGGMTNEKKEFPSVCNKSIQAQSTDIQAPIPEEIFQHDLTEFQKLSAKEMESLGRLNTPLYKSADSHKFQTISWQDAITLAAKKFTSHDPKQSFFYSSGRSSNEAGFILQLLARVYGTNNVNNCSYYCHQATGVGLANTIGTGTATIELDDLSKSDCIFVIGANPASNHPRFIHQLKQCRDRGGQVIIINPAKEPGLVKFAVPKSPRSMLKGGDEIASLYIQPNIGSDISVCNGIAKALFEIDAIDKNFIEHYTNDYDAFKNHIASLDWQSLSANSNISYELFLKIAELYKQSTNAVFAWGMGITHHLQGVENVEAISNLALLRGMIGKPGAGLLPLRGHSNVQGIGTIGVKPVLAESVFMAMQKHFDIHLPDTKGMDTLACLQAANNNEIQSALLMGGNLYAATPNTQWAKQAFNRIPFKLFLTTTLNQSHMHAVEHGESIILPVTARDEEWQATTQESMFNFVRLSDGGIKRLDNVKPESHILCDLAEAMLPDCEIDFAKFKNHNTVREAIAEIIPDMADLKDIHIAKQEFTVKQRLLHTPTFKTADGKANLICVSQTDDINSEYPFTLMSMRSEGQFNSIIYEEKDSYRGSEHRWTVFLNANDMQTLKIKDNDKITIESAHGCMPMVTAKIFDLPAGNIMAYYPEANQLIGLANDPRSKTPAFKNVAVRITV